MPRRPVDRLPSLRSTFKELVAEASAEETRAKEISDAKARAEAEEAANRAAAAAQARKTAAAAGKEAAISARVSQRSPP